MLLDAQTIINTLLMVLMGIGGWFFRELWEAVAMLRNEVKSVERKMLEDYVKKEDFQDRFNRVDDNLQRILDKLDNKLDKSHAFTHRGSIGDK